MPKTGWARRTWHRSANFVLSPDNIDKPSKFVFPDASNSRSVARNRARSRCLETHIITLKTALSAGGVTEDALSLPCLVVCIRSPLDEARQERHTAVHGWPDHSADLCVVVDILIPRMAPANREPQTAQLDTSLLPWTSKLTLTSALASALTIDIDIGTDIAAARTMMSPKAWCWGTGG